MVGISENHSVAPFQTHQDCHWGPMKWSIEFVILWTCSVFISQFWIDREPPLCSCGSEWLSPGMWQSYEQWRHGHTPLYSSGRTRDETLWGARRWGLVSSCGRSDEPNCFLLCWHITFTWLISLLISVICADCWLFTFQTSSCWKGIKRSAVISL